MIFWITAVIVLVLATGAVLWPLLRRRPDVVVPDEHPDIQVYRDQLAEVDSDLQRGILSEDAAKRTRVEIARRILEADKLDSEIDKTVGNAPLAGNVVAGLLVVSLGIGAFGIYRVLGADGAPDFPLAERRAQMAKNEANRPSQQEVEARVGDVKDMEKKADPAYLKLVEKLRKAAKRRPNDLKGQELLAQNEARIGHFAAASRAQEQVIVLKGAAANADDFTNLAELMIVAAGGYVSPLAEGALGKAIDLDRNNPRARYYSGLDLAQNGRPDLAYNLWSELLDEGPETAPWIRPIRAQIRDVARLAGMRIAPPATTQPPATNAGPTQAQIKSAGKLTAAQRQDFIKKMVARLSGRLLSDGGPAADWAKLINAYGVLGDREKARAITVKARAAYAGNDAALARIDSAAKRAGVAD